jgi:hypothetical protein
MKKNYRYITFTESTGVYTVFVILSLLFGLGLLLDPPMDLEIYFPLTILSLLISSTALILEKRLNSLWVFPVKAQLKKGKQMVAATSISTLMLGKLQEMKKNGRSGRIIYVTYFFLEAKFDEGDSLILFQSRNPYRIYTADLELQQVLNCPLVDTMPKKDLVMSPEVQSLSLEAKRAADGTPGKKKQKVYQKNWRAKGHLPAHGVFLLVISFLLLALVFSSFFLPELGLELPFFLLVHPALIFLVLHLGKKALMEFRSAGSVLVIRQKSSVGIQRPWGRKTIDLEKVQHVFTNTFPIPAHGSQVQRWLQGKWAQLFFVIGKRRVVFHGPKDLVEGLYRNLTQ